MNRLLFPCLLLLCLLSPRIAESQLIIWTNTASANSSVCMTPTGNIGNAYVIAHVNGAASYSWEIQPPSGCSQTPTFQCNAPAGPTCDSIYSINYDCCGEYSVIARAYDINGIWMTSDTALFTIICPNTASATPSKSVICLGEQITIVGNGANNYTWTPSSCGNIVGLNTANPVTVAPTCNSTYTMVGTTVSGCTVTATTSVAVQAASISITPSIQSMCLNSPVCFTATAFPAIGTSVTPGTATTGLQWYDPLNPPPGGTPFSTGFTPCTPAVGGVYHAILTHTGAAGTCTTAALGATVNITNSITVSASSNTTSACPGQTVQLTATSIQTAGASYTWTAPGGATAIGNPVIMPHNQTGTYTVDVDYFGCPGSGTVLVLTSTLTPTLTTVGGGSICPSSCATLQAYGGTTTPVYNYTFYHFHPITNIPSQVGTAGTSSMGSLIHCPPSPNASYSVYVTDIYGCSGGQVLFLQEFTITPQFGSLLGSACPSTQVTFTAGNVGAGANYTIVAGYTPTTIVYTGTNDTMLHVIPGAPPYTYTLQVDSAGCKGQTVTTVNPHVFQPILSSSSASFCPNTQFTLSSTGGSAATYSFFEVPGTPIPNTPNNDTVIYSPATLPATFAVVVDSANCVGPDTIVAYPLDLSPRLTLSASPGQSVCPNTTFTLSGNLTAGMNYTFIPPSVGTILSQTNNIVTASMSTLVPPSHFTVQIDSAGCTGIDSIPMFPFTMKPDLSAIPDSVCAGMPVQLCANGGTVTTYTFLEPTTSFPFFAVVGNSLTTSTCVTDNNGPIVPTTYTVVTDSLGCTGFDTVRVNITPGLTITASASNSFICSGSTVTLSVNGPTNAIYSWASITGTNNPVPVPGGTSLGYSVSSIVVNPTVTTQYIVTALDPAGCTGTAVVTVSINPSASLAISVSPASSTICGTNATLTASGGASYTWMPSAGLTPPVTNQTVLAQPLATTIYTVIGTNNLGCYGSATTQVQVGPEPTVQIVPTSYSVCPGYNATLTAFGAASYSWTSNTFTGTIAQQSVAGGVGTYTVTGSNGGTCIHDTVITIGSQKPLNISVTASPNGTACIEVNFPYKLSTPVILNASGAGAYFWQPYDPLSMTYSLGPQTTVRPPATTQYTVTGYTSTCSGTNVITVTVIPQFSMQVTPPLPAICKGDSLKLSITNISSLAVGPASKFTYSWTDPVPPSMTSQAGGLLSPTVMAYPQLTSTYSVEVEDARGCVSLPRVLTVTVFPRPITSIAIPTINNVPTNTVCFVGLHTGPPDVVITLVASNENTNLPFGVVPTYTWVSPYPSQYVSILTPPNNPQVTVGAPTKLPPVAIYTVLTGYNGVPGCSEIDTVHIKVVDCRPISTVTPPIFALADNIDTLCAMECITFIALTDTMAGGPQTYTWTFDGGNPPKSNEKNPRVCYNLPPSDGAGYNVILQVSNPYPVSQGGSERVVGIASYVKVVDIPNVSVIKPGNLRSDTTVRFGTPVQLSASGALTYSWSPNYNISSTKGKDVTVRPFRTTRYVVTGYNSKNCLSRDTIDVIVIEDCGAMFVPNAFSPNGDGHNDVLRVQGICLESMSFMIFNRWGEKIFESADQSVGWDGTYKGEMLNTGVFVYRLEGKTYDGKAYSSKGNITLIR